jgi:hypothetical protein
MALDMPLFGESAPPEEKPEPKPKLLSALDQGFLAFWAIYPRRVAKAAARKAWGHLKPSPALLATIIADVTRKRSSTQWCRENGQFVPYPATYINGRRWEDEDQRSNASSGERYDAEDARRLYGSTG